MARRQPFEFEEWYHCFNRGIDKRNVFESEMDANRFLMALFLANGTIPIGLYGIRKPKLASVLGDERGRPIVAVGAYCLMPNHFHLLLKEIEEDGITKFMQKLSTAYTMYFNAKNERVGNLFLKPFRSRHVSNDRYFQKVLQYIHCNPAELYEPGWKSGKVRNIRALERKLLEYPYSSLKSYVQRSRTDPILSSEGFEIAAHPTVSKMLGEARAYYAELSEADFDQ